MRKLFASCLLLALLASCQEWDPVFTGTYRTPDEREPEMAAVNTTIAELKQRYIDNGGKAVEFTDHVVIGGQVISSDRSGNIYRELYIQDETGAISVTYGGEMERGLNAERLRERLRAVQNKTEQGENKNQKGKGIFSLSPRRAREKGGRS